jgi:hypothetical protein
MRSKSPTLWGQLRSVLAARTLATHAAETLVTREMRQNSAELWAGVDCLAPMSLGPGDSGGLQDHFEPLRNNCHSIVNKFDLVR